MPCRSTGEHPAIAKAWLLAARPPLAAHFAAPPVQAAESASEVSTRGKRMRVVWDYHSAKAV